MSAAQVALKGPLSSEFGFDSRYEFFDAVQIKFFRGVAAIKRLEVVICWAVHVLVHSLYLVIIMKLIIIC